MLPEPKEEMTAPTRRGSFDVGDNRPLDGVNVPVPDDEFFGDTVSLCCFIKISASHILGKLMSLLLEVLKSLLKRLTLSFWLP